MRLYYFLDENEVGSHCSHWDAFSRLQKEGFLEDFKICSFRSLEKEILWHELLENSKREIISFHPNRIVLSHTGKRIFPKQFFEDVRKAIPEVKFIYDERDVHGLFAKPIPLATLQAAKQCDKVILVAEGWYAALYKKFGCKDVKYLSHVTDDVRFGRNYHKTPGSEFDVVMIGNYINARFIKIPGTRFRQELAQKLSKRYGKKFGLFGRGWDRIPSWQGPCKYSEQEAIIQGALCSIGADHFPAYTNYFSDRLPIALYAGRPHFTYNTPGVQQQFYNVPSLHIFSKIDAVEKSIDHLISNPHLYFSKENSTKTRQYVESHMLEINRQRIMLECND
jgi:hypothetical protein